MNCDDVPTATAKPVARMDSRREDELEETGLEGAERRRQVFSTGRTGTNRKQKITSRQINRQIRRPLFAGL